MTKMMKTMKKPVFTLSGTDDLGWPDQAAGIIPDSGNIVTWFYAADEGITITIEGMTKTEATLYIDDIKAAGFTEDDYSAESGDGISYFAYDEEEAYLSFSWMNDGTAWISYMPATAEE